MISNHPRELNRVLKQTRKIQNRPEDPALLDLDLLELPEQQVLLEPQALLDPPEMLGV